MANAEIKLSPIPAYSRAARKTVEFVTRPVFKREIEDPNNNLTRLENLSRDGHAIIVAHTHPSKGDPPRVDAVLFRNGTFRGLEIMSPVTVHQYKDWFRLAGIPLHFQTERVVTPDTYEAIKTKPKLLKKLYKEKTEKDDEREKRKTKTPERKPRGVFNRLTALQDHLPHQAQPFPEQEEMIQEVTKYLKDSEKHMAMTYLKKGVDVVKKNGIVAVAPQGERQPELESVTSAVSALLRICQKRGIDKIAVAFIGINFQKPFTANGYNPGTGYQLIIGSVKTLPEIMLETGGKTEQIDALVMQGLKDVSPAAYLKPV